MNSVMKTDDQQTEEFLRRIVLPEYNSEPHARQLRAQLLSRLQARHAGRATGPRWKTAALLLGLLAAAALATETVIQVRHYYFYGKAKDPFYYFSTTAKTGEGTNQADSIGIFVPGGLDNAGIEQKRKDLEEIDALRKRNARELFRVLDTQVNGKPSGRLFFYKYSLADGRTEIITETLDTSLSPAQVEAGRQEVANLRQRGQRELLEVVQVEFRGQLKRTLTWRYLLSDGRAVTTYEPDPELPGPVPLTFDQEVELTRLAVLEKKGKLLGTTQVQVLGRAFNLQKFSFTLSDGAVVMRSQGEPERPKDKLTAADGDELRQLAEAHKGQTLSTYEETVNGNPFKFTRVRYVLSDRTEVIQSVGTPGAR